MENIKNLLNTEYIMIFGAKATIGLKHRNFGLHIEDEIHKYGKKVTCYVVSSKENNPDSVDGVPVKEISEIPENYKREGVIVISNALNRQDEIGSMLNERGFQHILYGVRRYSNLSIYEKECYKQYGWNISMEYISGIYEERATIDNLSLYVVTSHNNTRKTAQMFESKMAHYIQAGSALTDMTVCDIKDNMGTNISSKNPLYCEISAGYWIYKNDNIHDYVGLYHYSRVFDLSDDEILKILNSGIDAILAEPVIYFARRGHYWCNDTLLQQVFEKKSPQYMECFNNYINEGLFIPSNMVICSKKIYDNYYQWMMSILEKYEQELNTRNVEIMPRMLGYIAEELTGIYFLNHSADLNLLFVKQRFTF